jgi:hypothetical protein
MGYTLHSTFSLLSQLARFGHHSIPCITTSSSDTTPPFARSHKQADTPGCTNQACGFRDHLSEIKELGYDIYGLSKDKPAALKRVCPFHLLLLHDYLTPLFPRIAPIITPHTFRLSG